MHVQPLRDSTAGGTAWKGYELFVFRVAFIFFVLITVPLDPGYYKLWFTLDWSKLHIRDMGALAGRGMHFISIDSESGNFGLASYIDWFISLGIGIVGAVVWGLIDRKTTNYKVLYYFLTALVSHAMLIKLQGLTFSKVFPSQMPELAMTQLNTPFGDFTPQKLYWLQFSFVHGYEIFAGLAELMIMLLLFFRQTRAWGAALAIAMVGNIALANHLYDGGVHVLAMLYFIGGVFVLWRYLPAIWNLIVNEKDVTPSFYHYPFKKKWEKYLRLAFKTFVFVFFFGVSAYLHWHNYKYDSYKVPSRPGIAGTRGLYEVTEFRLNNKVIPYSPTDSVRWQNVSFEKWSTLSFSVFNTFNIHGEAGRGKQFKDVDRTYESAGTGGGRRHYYYEADSAAGKLVLFNKNKVYKDERMNLAYSRPTENRIILSGINETRDSLYIVLDRKDRTYPLYAGKKQALEFIP
ncbi:MAG: hypothetical protein H7Y03_07390 [Chitinophagaceae bacterium]|nr:hypothetical protein [Chitinophagaceae bacterium]